ncbi:Mitochondrial oxaloacetate carrier protein [Irineochytrium annulatum]|nr:Mitochondrial oxaloacetate carrier protein [Irineochytrium annulatum]
MAVTFTNPWEVVKTRLQLQGELESRHTQSRSAGPPPPKQYKSAVSAFSKIVYNEGVRGIQRGLAPAYAYQVVLNGTRLGLYEPIRDLNVWAIGGATGKSAAEVSGGARAFAMVASGGMCGVLGSFLASPLYLVKTRMQSYSPQHAVGHQHTYVTKGTAHALSHVYRSEGVRGLWRGVDAAMVRTGIGSAVQLSSYDGCKRALLKSGWFNRQGGEGGIELHFAASAVTSLFVCIAMNPFDVISTRLYNQHVVDGKQGSLYSSGLDCFMKTVRAEGLGALYKGFSAHYLRIGPHTILTFVFLEQVKKGFSYFLD